jgi:hypothetical protein
MNLDLEGGDEYNDVCILVVPIMMRLQQHSKLPREESQIDRDRAEGHNTFHTPPSDSRETSDPCET